MANLGITVDTSGIKGGIADLDALVPAAMRAEAAIDKLATGAAQSGKKIETAFGGGQPPKPPNLDPVINVYKNAANQIETVMQRVERITNVKPPSVDTASRTADLAAYGKALDDLRAKFNPLFAAEQQHVALMGQIKQAHAVGAISTDEMTNAVLRETQAFAKLNDTLNAANANAQYGKELDDLKQKFVPLYAAEQAHIRNVNEITSAQMKGAISADEMTVALARETAAYEKLALSIREADAAAVTGSTAQTGAPGQAAGKGAKTQQTGMQQMMQTNLMYQLQDIAVTTAMGMAPAMIALQQGTQIASVMASAGGIKQGLGAIVGSLTSILSLSSLLPIAIVGVGAALYQWATGAGEKIKTLDELTKEHTKSVEALAKMYGVAGVSAQDMGAKAQSVIEAEERNTKRALVEGLKREQERLFGQANPDSWMQGLTLPGELGGSDVNTRQEYRVAEKYEAFAEPLEDLQKELAKGLVPDMGAFDAWINQIAGADPVLRKLHDDLVGVTAELRAGALAAGANAEAMMAREQKLAELERQTRAARTDAEKIAAAEAQAADKYKNMLEGELKTKRILNEVDKTRNDLEQKRVDYAYEQESKHTVALKNAQDELDLMKLAGAELEVRRQQIQEIREVEEMARKAGVEIGKEGWEYYQKLIDAINTVYEKLLGIKRVQEEINQGNELAKLDADIQRMNARTDAERMAAAVAGATAGVPAGDNAEHAVELATRREAANIEKEIADSTRARHQALEDLVQTQKDQLALLDLEGGALYAAQEKLRLINELRKEAAEHGRIVSDADIAAINAAADAAGRVADELTRAQLVKDLEFERSLIYMSPSEQEVASRLRGTGISTDSDIADSIRRNQQEAEIVELATSTAKDFLGGISDVLVEGGEDIGENLIKAIVDSAQRTLDKILDKLLDSLINKLLGVGGAGGATEGGLIDALINALIPTTTKAAGAADTATSSVASTAATAAVDAVTTAATGGASTGEKVTDWLKYANEGATRNLKLSDNLVEQMSFVGDMGYYMTVVSGGQPSTGSNRTGSHRHDWGNAADVFFTNATTGEKVDFDTAKGKSVISEIVSRASGAGVTGFGAGEGYMGDDMIHLGGGSKATWGKSLTHETAPGWLDEAVNNPISSTKDFDRSVSKAATTTDSFNKSVEDATDSTKSLGASVESAAVEAKKAADATTKAAPQAADALSKVGDAGTEAVNGLGNLGKGLGSFTNQLSGWLAGAGGGGGGGFDWSSLLGIFTASSAPTGAVTSSLASGWSTRLHEGNIGSSTNLVHYGSMAPWVDAVRLHNGNVKKEGLFKTDEIPAVLKKGEPVFTSMDEAKKLIMSAYAKQEKLRVKDPPRQTVTAMAKALIDTSRQSKAVTTSTERMADIVKAKKPVANVFSAEEYPAVLKKGEVVFPSMEKAVETILKGEKTVKPVTTTANARFTHDMTPWVSAVRLHDGNVFTSNQRPAGGTPASVQPGKTTINIHNNVGADVKTQEEKGPEGVTIDVMVDRMVAQQIDQRGSASNNAIRSKFGVSERLRLR